jgi:hypothetical protein
MGVMGGGGVISFVHLALMAVQSQDNLREWVYYWCGNGQVSWLEPEGWFDGAEQLGSFVWSPTPAAAEVVLNKLCKSQLKCPVMVAHALIVPCLIYDGNGLAMPGLFTSRSQWHTVPGKRPIMKLLYFFFDYP